MSGRRAFICVGRCAALQQPIDLVTVVKYRGSERAGDARGHSYRRATKRPACGAARCRVGALKASPDQAPGAVKAVAIPAGVEVNLKVGSVGYITQALGGSFTVYIDGSLFRIAGSDADSIDKEMAKPPEVPPGASDDEIKSVVWQQLKTCYDPEIPINIVDLGLVYKCDVQKNADETRTVEIKMTLTAPGCGMGEVLVQDVRDKVEIVPTVTKANVELLFDPPWNQTMMSEEARLRTGMM